MMHEFNGEMGELFDQAVILARQRRSELPPIGGPKSRSELATRLSGSIIPTGIGGIKALDRFIEVIASSVVAGDHPRFFAFIGHAPSEASVIADMLLSAFPMYGGDWLEGAGAIQAENEALAWIAKNAGLPDSAGGCFVSGGTIGNLSALHAARHRFRLRHGASLSTRLALIASSEVHSSVVGAANVLDVDVIQADVAPGGKLTGRAVRAAIAGNADRVFAVVASAGTTNLGIVDDLESIGDVCQKNDIWFHVDGAYGLAALASPAARSLFSGIETCDSLIVDPHKWLFSTYDCCALLYRDPEDGRAAHAQQAAYLDVLRDSHEWQPTDYAIHLSRRARGVPVWFSLAVNGTDAYAAAIDATMAVARQAAIAIGERPWLRLIQQPELSIVAFERTGWDWNRCQQWAEMALEQGIGFVTPSSFDESPILRLSIIHPRTTIDDIVAVLDSTRLQDDEGV